MKMRDNVQIKMTKRTTFCEFDTMKFSKLYQIVRYSIFFVVHEKKFDYNKF